MPNDTWRVVASSGTYAITERTCAHALITFLETHPDDFVTSVAMVTEPIDGIALARVADVLTANHGCTDYDATAELAAQLIRAYPDVRAAASVSLDRVTSALDHSVAAAMRHLADTGGF
jgi:hypothetical protein